MSGAVCRLALHRLIPTISKSRWEKKITKCSLPLKKPQLPFFSLIKNLKKMHPLFCRSLAHTLDFCAHTRNPPTSTNGAERRKSRRAEIQKIWCLVFITHTRVARSVTLFRLSSSSSLYQGGLNVCETRGDDGPSRI